MHAFTRAVNTRSHNLSCARAPLPSIEVKCPVGEEELIWKGEDGVCSAGHNQRQQQGGSKQIPSLVLAKEYKEQGAGVRRAMIYSCEGRGSYRVVC